MTTIYGRHTAGERLCNVRQQMVPNHRVAIDHDFYSDNPEAAREVWKNVDRSRRDLEGDAVGYNGREEVDDYTKSMKKPLKRAIGGIAKLRKDYPKA